MKAALPRLRGAFALAFLFEGDDDLMIGARKGAPLAVGYGDGEMYLGSDAIALAPFTDRIAYLEDGDWVVLTREARVIYDARRRGGEPRRDQVTAHRRSLVDKGNYRHFMAKEIHEQPEVVGHTLARYVDMATERVALPAKLPFDFTTSSACRSSACGTAYYAGWSPNIGSSAWRALPVEIDIASEFRYREAPLRKGDLAIFISQSGETADTLAALRYAKAQGAADALGRQRADFHHCARSETVLPTLAGPEIGVASTKAFTCQLWRWRRWRSRPARRAANCPRPTRRRLVHGAGRSAASDGGGACTEPQIEKLAARHRQSRRTCSISAAAPAIRWRWKAR